MFSLKVNRILTYTVEVCKAIAEAIILAAFVVALLFWIGALVGIIRWY